LARSAEELVALAAVDGQPAYRGKQLMDGVLHGARSVDDIRNVRRGTENLDAGTCAWYLGFLLTS